MEQFKEISPSKFDDNIFNALNNQWMLITAQDHGSGKFNMMTASWGGFGILWGKPVCFCVIRPQRYTFEFSEKCDRMTLSFFGDHHRDELKLCGSKSGRDCNKLALTGLTSVEEDDYVYYDEAETVIVGRKLYADYFRAENFFDTSLVEQNYPNEDFHRIYICEIEKILKKV